LSVSHIMEVYGVPPLYDKNIKIENTVKNKDTYILDTLEVG